MPLQPTLRKTTSSQRMSHDLRCNVKDHHTCSSLLMLPSLFTISVSSSLTIASTMGTIMEVVAVLEIHMLRNMVGSISPSMSSLGLVPIVIRALRAILWCRAHFSTEIATIRDPRKIWCRMSNNQGKSYLWTSCWTPWSRWCRHHWLRESWTEAAELWGGEQWPGEEHTQWPSRLPSPVSRTHTWPPEFQHRTPGDRGEQVLPESLLSSSIAVFVISSSWWLSPHFLSNTVPHFTKLVLKRLLHRIIIKFVCCTLSHFKSVKIIFDHEDEILYCS